MDDGVVLRKMLRQAVLLHHGFGSTKLKTPGGMLFLLHRLVRGMAHSLRVLWMALRMR